MQGGNLKQRRGASARSVEEARERLLRNALSLSPRPCPATHLPLQASNLQSMGVAKPEGARRYLLVGSVAGGQSQVGRGFLHFYHYNELHSSDYHYYDVTYIYTIREKFDLQIYHI